MITRKRATRSSDTRRNHGERLKDEVYRQMFRLEAGRPGADLALTIALVRGWLDADSKRGQPAMREWLKKICPICLSMVEATGQSNNTVNNVSSEHT